MNHPFFSQLRRDIDEAITFHDLDEAGRLAAEGLRLAGEKECPAEACYFRAQQEIISEQFEAAIPHLRRALQLNPADGAAYNDLALCRIELGQIDGALELFDQGIAVEPDYATIHHNKGWFLNMLGQHETALVSFEKALEIEPGRAVTYENMADAYEHLGRIDEALSALREALRLVRASFPRIRQQIEEELRRLEKRREDERA